MRADLEILEKIDLYLGDNMSAVDKAAFEGQMNNDHALQRMVENQQLLIKTVNRQALMAEINSVAGTIGTSSTWYNSVTTWVVSIIIITGLVAGLVVYNIDESPEIVENVIENEVPPIFDQTVDENVDDKSIDEEIVDEESIPIPPPILVRSPWIYTSAVSNIGNNDTIYSLKDYSSIVIAEVTDNMIDTIDDAYVPIINKNKRACFPGGEIPMKKYFAKNLKFPGTARKKEIEGNVRVSFIVNSTGIVDVTRVQCVTLKGSNQKPFNSIKVMMNRKVKKLFENEARRLFRLMPSWEPATDKYGSPMTVPMEIYIDFDINGNSTAYDLEFDNSEIKKEDLEENSRQKKDK